MKNGDLEALKTLLDKKTEKNPVVYQYDDGANPTVLHVAAYHGQIDIIRWYHDILNFGNINPVDNKGNTPLKWAVDQQEIKVLEYYLNNGYSASSKNIICLSS